MSDTVLKTDRLILRNWREEDRDLFHEINSDPEIMRFFPFRRTREESDRLMDLVAGAIARNGFGFFALAERESRQCVGFAGLSEATLTPAIPAPVKEIGWRLKRDRWGRGYVTEAALTLLDFGFHQLQFDEIVSFAVRDNTRSIAVMRRIGMTADPARDFDHPRVPDSHPDLKRHVFFYARPDQSRAE